MAGLSSSPTPSGQPAAVCAGLRVLDFSSWMAGPLATGVLSDYGAEVIKVEPPAGDPARRLPAFQTWNRGKRSLVLDLRSPGGRKTALGLAEAADVVVTSWRPGVAERLGLGYDDVQRINRGAIYVSITGYGESGQRARLKGYEGLVAAKSGRMMMFEGVAPRPGPAFPAVPCASYSAGMLALQGILAGLHMRRRTGRGQKVSVSLLAALMPFDIVMWIGWQLRGKELETEGQTAPMILQKLLGERKPPAGPGTYDPTQLYRPGVRIPRPNYLVAVTKDGVWLQFANTTDRLCLAQMQALDLLELYGDERFAKLPAVFTEDAADELWGLVLETVRSKTYEEWAARFTEYEDLAVERLRWPAEALDHPQVRHNRHVIEVPGLDGKPTFQPGPIVRVNGVFPTVARRAPRLGEHSQEILSDRGGWARHSSPVDRPDAPNDSRAPLDGITIVDFSTWIAAPYSTSLLASLGARVIKVEQVGGDTSRYSTGGLLSFPMTQGKESIALNLKDPRGLEVVQRLIARADAVVHNFRPGVPERLGIDYDSCRRLNPRVIYLNEASYGDTGPDARRPAFFASIAAVGGNTFRQAGAGHPRPDAQRLPLHELKEEAWRLLKAAEGNADPIASLAAAAAFLLGLHAREETGQSQDLMTTMVCSDMWANSDECIAYAGCPAPASVDEELMGLSPVYRLYRAREGWVFLACLERSEWESFCRLTGKQDWKSRWEGGWQPGSAGARILADDLARLFRERDASEWESLATREEVPLVAVEQRDPGRFNIQDAGMRELGHAVQVESSIHGSYWRHGALQQFSDAGQVFRGWEPLGGHTKPILRELGYSDDAIEMLIRDGVAEAWPGEAPGEPTPVQRRT